MLTQQSIRDFLAQSDYDIRESGNGRWIDQKCTPDVVCAVADFICNYVADDPSPGSCPFTSKEIWHSEYASQYVEAVFKKPATKNKNAKHEYDKFFQQPMELLAYANVLGKQKIKGKNYYWVKQINILEYIALREQNALTFLVLYIEKTLHDSGLWPVFHTFLQSSSSKTYTEVRNAFLISHSCTPKSISSWNAAASSPKYLIHWHTLTIPVARKAEISLPISSPTIC